MFVRVIIVNFRTAGLVIDCLRSLEAERNNVDFTVTVVDGCSGDDSVERMGVAISENNWQSWVEQLPLNRNGGFAYANNAAIRIALDQDPHIQFVYLLNPDTIVKSGAISSLTQFLQSNKSIGVAGSQVLAPDGSLDPSARRSPSWWSEFAEAARFGLIDRLFCRKLVSMPHSESPVQCDWVSGAAMMVRRAVFEEIGFLDDKYFLYYEELDFCDRARRASWQIWHVPESLVVHIEGAATGIKAGATRRAPYWYQSRRRYFIRQHGVFGWLLADAAWAIGRVSLLSRRLLGLGGSTIGDPRSLSFDLIFGDLYSLFSGEFLRIRKN